MKLCLRIKVLKEGVFMSNEAAILLSLSIALLSCTHAICEIYHVDEGLARITEIEMIHSTPSNELINRQLYPKSCR